MAETIVFTTPRCRVCKHVSTLVLDKASFEAWRNGELIQHAFPTMSAGDREILISGTHPACWDQLMGGLE